MKHRDKLRECPRLEVEKETQYLIHLIMNWTLEQNRSIGGNLVKSE